MKLVIGLTYFASFLFCIAVGEAQERKLAVVIGVNAYRSNSGLPRLKHAEADAEALSGTLREVGYKVYKMTHAAGRQAGQEEMAPQLAYIRDQIQGVLEYPNLGANDAVLITLHGHGVQYDQIGSDGTKTPKFYFCPADATVSGLKSANDITERNRLLPLDELYADLESCKAATKLLIVDACRNDPTAPGVFRESLASATLPKLPPPRGGTAAFFSCKPNQRAVEDANLQKGVFTHFLVKGLQGKADISPEEKPADGVITFAELSAYVADNTYAYVFTKFKARQSPELRGKYDPNMQIATVPLPSDINTEHDIPAVVEIAKHDPDGKMNQAEPNGQNPARQEINFKLPVLTAALSGPVPKNWGLKADRSVSVTTTNGAWVLGTAANGLASPPPGIVEITNVYQHGDFAANFTYLAPDAGGLDITLIDTQGAEREVLLECRRRSSGQHRRWYITPQGTPLQTIWRTTPGGVISIRRKGVDLAVYLDEEFLGTIDATNFGALAKVRMTTWSGRDPAGIKAITVNATE